MLVEFDVKCAHTETRQLYSYWTDTIICHCRP